MRTSLARVRRLCLANAGNRKLGNACFFHLPWGQEGETKYRMHFLGIMALLAAAAADAGAPAEPTLPVQIELSGSPSFSAEELAHALAPRLPPGAKARFPSRCVRTAWSS
jgi:hypothetical protein